MRIESAREIKARLWREAASWSAEPRRADEPPPGVAIGVQVRGDGSYGVAVRHSGDSELAAAVAELGRELAGADYDVRDIGAIQTLRWRPEQLQQRVRPLRPGLSIAHRGVSAGSIGAFVVPPGRAEPVRVLSNNHVLADSDRGVTGDPILQPGPADGGEVPGDRVGVLDQVVPIQLGRSNLVDAATAVLDAGIEFDLPYPAGALCGVAEPASGVMVEKVGRSTGVTRGQISAIELDGLRVQFPSGVVTFDGQVEITGDGTGAFSAGGDSGSVVYDPIRLTGIGLLFAGSERGGPNGSGLTYCNPFGTVLAALGMRLLAG